MQVYLETSFVSACVSRKRDPASIYHRAVSQDWWETQAGLHRCFISGEVLLELNAPAHRQREEALALVKGVPVLRITDKVIGFAEILVRKKVMPGPVAGDALHVAVAAVHEIEYILSWNVRHLANPRKLDHLRSVCLCSGLLVPTIVTPDQFWEDTL